MPFIEWDESFSVNVAEIDDQHKKIFKMVCVFYETLVQDKKRELSKLLDSLIDYAAYHFDTEEKYFAEFDYSESQGHIKQHQAFIEKVKDVKERYGAGELVLSKEITLFVKDWIKNHIKIEDKKYSKCFNSNGLIS